jgi:hypothetical protein
MSDQLLQSIRDLIQEDPGGRGLRTDPVANLVTACAGDFAAACRSLAGTPDLAVAVVTGFLIPHADPPRPETDGPLGAVFLARALTALGARVLAAADASCVAALEAGLHACDLHGKVRVLALPPPGAAEGPEDYRARFASQAGRLTHLIALERVGPSHTPESVAAQAGSGPGVREAFLQAVPAEHRDRCHTMRGLDISDRTSPAHYLFEPTGRPEPAVTTVGIGDGGNEIGMGKVPWEVIRRNMPSGGLVACRVPTDRLVVCGVSNWGAYGLAAGVRHLRGAPPDPDLFDPNREAVLLQVMVERGRLVDGMSGTPRLAVDGLSVEEYVQPLRRLRELAV